MNEYNDFFGVYSHYFAPRPVTLKAASTPAVMEELEERQEKTRETLKAKDEQIALLRADMATTVTSKFDTVASKDDVIANQRSALKDAQESEDYFAKLAIERFNQLNRQNAATADDKLCIQSLRKELDQKQLRIRQLIDECDEAFDDEVKLEAEVARLKAANEVQRAALVSMRVRIETQRKAILHNEATIKRTDAECGGYIVRLNNARDRLNSYGLVANDL